MNNPDAYRVLPTNPTENAVNRTKKQIAIDEKRVSRLYAQSCANVQINLMDIPKVARVGMEALLAGDSDDAIKSKIRAFVDTIRV